jgi:hypothetical protein
MAPSLVARVRWRERRELITAILLASLLVVARSYVFAAYEHSFFDSDQAIVGLMAKHLSEGRAFPLFFYGQSYMLAVEAWLAAPLFWIGPPTVATLRASLILTNVLVAALLIYGLERWAGVRPMLGLVACLFFVFPPPSTASFLVEAQGGSIEPFLYVSLLWILRHRPVWFGSVLAIGFLNREFTIYAVPVLLLGEAWRRRLWRAPAIRHWVIAFVAFLAVWEGIQALKPFADLLGPGTRGELLWGYGGSQIDNLLGRVRVAPAEFWGRLVDMGRGHIPLLLGATRFETGIAPQGRDWLAWPMGALALLLCGRIAWLSSGRLKARPAAASVAGAGFAWYLLGVGLVAAGAFVLTRPVMLPYARYGLLVLLIPIGLVGILFSLERNRWIRGAMVASVCGWSALAAVDHLAYYRSYRGPDRPNELRILADELIARRVDVAVAGYWRAYKLTFLTGERVKVASNDFIRIAEYQDLAAKEGAALIEVRESACPGGDRISAWYLCRPGS